MRPLNARLREEGGFALPAVLIITFVCGLLAIAVLNGVTGDLPSARADQDRRTALDAAQAGAAWYSAMLREDPSYWSKCANVPSPDGTNPAPVRATPVPASATDADTQRTWRNVTGSAAQYTVEMVPAPGYSACDPANAARSMLQNGAFRIRVTGRVSSTSTRKRSIIATYRKAGFMNYVYYTKFESQDPDTDDDANTTSAGTSCGQPLLNPDFNNGAYNAGCKLISWASGDAVKGPFHTEDTPIGCGSPVFGRTNQSPPDPMEVRSTVGYYNYCNGAGPTYNGPYVVGAGSVDLPPDNQSLKAIAQSGGRLLTGRGTIVLAANNFTWQVNGTSTRYDYPGNGLIYVQGNGGACPKYTTANVSYYTGGSVTGTSGQDLACGTVDVSGSYARDLTIAAANDIIVRGNITRDSSSSTAMLGLVANDFVRVWHPVTPAPAQFNYDSNGNRTTCKSANASTDKVTTIQAGILAVGHSFIVDNFNCGAQLGNLNVTGAIAQKWRGPVATANSTGYTKNYVYNDDFAYREPPNFLDPVQSAWVLTRQNEQFPAT